MGGARLADEVARTVRPVLGCTLQQVFGMAEGLLNYTRLDDPEDVICTTQGRPMSEGDEVRVVDELDQDVPDGTPGALLTRGPYTPRGYYRAAEQNARAFTADGWYRSGDIVRRRPDGNLVVEGRDKDMINRGGEKISAEEVENLAYQLPQVAQVAAVAMPDAALGERVCLYAVLKPGTTLTLEDVRQAMATAGVATFKWPERLEIVDELRTTKVGKIDKKALREDIAQRLAAREDVLVMTQHLASPVSLTAVDAPDQPTAPTPALEELYRGFEKELLVPLWTEIGDLMPLHPAVPRRPAPVALGRTCSRWPTRPADLVPVGRGGERRAIALANPALGGKPYATPTLWAAIQYLMPGEDAPEHRHTQHAFRFVVEGEGVWTVVGGDPVAMRRGDFLPQAGWNWHAHHNAANAPDGLDRRPGHPVPVRHRVAVLRVRPGRRSPSRSGPPRSAPARERLWGHPGLRPVSAAGATPGIAAAGLPLGATPMPRSPTSWSWRPRATPGWSEPGHAAVRYTNPTTGGDVLPTIRAEMHRHRAGGDRDRTASRGRLVGVPGLRRQRAP